MGMKTLSLALLCLVLTVGCGALPADPGGFLPGDPFCPAPWHRCGDQCWPGGTSCDQIVDCGGDTCVACGGAVGLVPWCGNDGALVCCGSDDVACADGTCAGHESACGDVGPAAVPASCDVR